jgi:hypothetical protein
MPAGAIRLTQIKVSLAVWGDKPGDGLKPREALETGHHPE